MCQFRLIFSSKLNVVSMKWQFFIGHWHCYCYCCCDMYILSLIKFNALSSVCIQISMQLNGIHRLPSYGNCDVHKLFGIFSGLKRFQWSHNFKTSVNIQDFPRFFLSQKWFLPKKLNSDVMRYFRQANKCLFTHFQGKASENSTHTSTIHG